MGRGALLLLGLVCILAGCTTSERAAAPETEAPMADEVLTEVAFLLAQDEAVYSAIAGREGPYGGNWSRAEIGVSRASATITYHVNASLAPCPVEVLLTVSFDGEPIETRSALPPFTLGVAAIEVGEYSYTVGFGSGSGACRVSIDSIYAALFTQEEIEGMATGTQG